MADPSADNIKILSDGSEVAQTFDAVNFDGGFGVVKDQGIVTISIADEAIEESQLADEAVTADKLADDAVTTDKIEDEAVTTDKLAEDAVHSSNIDDAAVNLAHLESGISPSHVVKFAGLTDSENDGDASVVATVTGVAATDVVVATILAQAGTATILKAVPTTNTLTFTLSGNGGAGTRISYVVFRAAV